MIPSSPITDAVVAKDMSALGKAIFEQTARQTQAMVDAYSIGNALGAMGNRIERRTACGICGQMRHSSEIRWDEDLLIYTCKPECVVS